MDLREVESRGEIISTNRHPWEDARIEVVKLMLKRYKSEFKNKVILDIGCGDTHVVESLSLFFTESEFYAIDTAFNNDLLLDYENKLKGTSISLFKTLDEAINYTR